MNTVIAILIGLAMLATLVAVAVGIISSAVHGDFYMRNANNLMRMRVIFQGIAVGVVAFGGFLTWLSS